MTIEQTIEIPASHRIFLDLPRELPIGKAKVEFTITPQTIPENRRKNVFGCAKGQFTMAEDFDAALEDFKEYM
jgi:hypothetical protein